MGGRPAEVAGRTALRLSPVADIVPRSAAEPSPIALVGRNAYPVVGQVRGRSRTPGLAIGAGLALLLGGATLWTMSGHRAPAPTVPVVTPAVVPRPAAMPASVVAPNPPAALSAQRKPPSIAAIEAAAAPAMVFDGSGAPGLSPAAPPAGAPAKSAVVSVPASIDDNDRFAARLGGSDDVAVAQRLADPATTIAQGTLIAAVLETAIDTDLPGYARAVVSRDVKSFDGLHVLIPRSTRLVGQYKSGLAAGQTRAYVIWTRLIRPDGVTVALGSPAVDESGGAGLAGKVDGHFLKRFGAATLLTVIGGLSAIGNNAVLVSGGQSVGAVAAQSSAQIPPTIRVPQGQPIRVFTARDLDFSTGAAGQG